MIPGYKVNNSVRNCNCEYSATYTPDEAETELSVYIRNQKNQTNKDYLLI
jgi:hypothetical protein